MKQFRLLGMTLVALIMSVGLVACSSSDNDDNNGDGGNSPKKLTKVISSYGGGHETAIFFSYDTNGKLKSYNDGENTYTFNWSDDIVTFTNTDGKTETCYIADNLIRNSTVYNTNYYYNDNNKLTNIKTKYYTDSVKWDGDKITEQYYIFSYSGKTCKGFNPVILELKNLFYGNYWLSACPELIGAKSNQLPDGFKYKNNDNKEAKISYTFDSEGYVTEFTIQFYYNGAPSTSHYDDSKHKLTWE